MNKIMEMQIWGLRSVGFTWRKIEMFLSVSERTLRRRRQELGWPVAGLLLEAGTWAPAPAPAPAPVYCERSTRLFCLGIEKGKPKKS